MSSDNHRELREPNEDRLAALLRSIDADAPPPDADLLAIIGQQAAAAFAETAAGQPPASSEFPGSPAAVETSATGGMTDEHKPEVHVQHPSTNSTVTTAAPAPQRTTMFTLALRSLIGLVASTAALAMWFGLAPSNVAVGASPFSDVLTELRAAKTLQLRVSKSGQSAEVWVRAPGLVRREDSPQQYQIAAGSRLWDINEATNTAVEKDSPWFLSPEKQIDLLGLLDVGVTDASALLSARPVERMTRDGRDCLIYRVDVPANAGQLTIEAAADAKTLQLVEITAREAGDKKRAGPPLAELHLVALNLPVEDEKFVVAKSLTEDGRIGKIGQAQGIVVLRPMLAKRWTPVCRETLLKPGDWLRTELRGANAVKATLSSQVELTIGPGSLVEFLSPTQARIHSGSAQVVAPTQEKNQEPTTFTLLAPRTGNRAFRSGDKQLVRVDRDEKLADVPQIPVWLAGFEGTTNNESLGSLIVNLPDGRNEPLTVGYHKVSVEIRDQIARTTIEESFVNHTPRQLEGVFHFPLPQDASISGFGMWIGNDLVEADVVEKQRAREIYETILREKRDPGLLEWTGGNIFKARVFPIEGRSEKRIKIVYTQVLPLRAHRYRYSYGLRSELLRTNPLRELSLTVTVNSTLPLKSISSPSHPVRVQQTAHSAKLEFAAQEYTPSRDFEVVCEVDGKQSDVVAIPHRRGSDGYFLMQLSPPSGEGNWQRELLPDGKPLNVLLLCDSSASMDAEKRQQQAEFVGSVLSSLGTEDRFQLGAADVGMVWAFSEPTAPTPENVTKAKAFLDGRQSLGWTDLDRAFQETIKKLPPSAHVIYVGDGIVSAGNTDPAAFVRRLGQLLVQPDKSDARRVFHAVSVGNSNESVVLKGIAGAGGGSVRTIGGEQTPQVVALELLNEIALPGIRDINIEFRGLKVAAVYPNKLPNVAAGTQQILVGRYLPEGKDQTGEIIVTGRRGSESVRFVAKVNLKDAEEGNSFIPRLWARAHLDQLLAQGTSDFIRDEIIRLSEEFHIITPYTSLLVLETDADRERFGVQRRYEMRDGERYFTAGRDNAHFELLQQQMKRAGDWRLGLRRQFLRSLANTGRNRHDFDVLAQQYRGDLPYGLTRGRFDWNGPADVIMPSFYRRSGVAIPTPSSGTSLGGMGGSGGMGGGGGWSSGLELSDFRGENFEFGTVVTAGDALGDLERLKDIADKEESAVEEQDKKFDGLENDVDELVAFDVDSAFGLHDGTEFDGGRLEPGLSKSLSESFDRRGLGLRGAEKSKISVDSWAGSMLRQRLTAGSRNQSFFSDALGRQVHPAQDLSWLTRLFPTVAPPPAIQPTVEQKGAEWPAEAVALSKSLLRTDRLLKLDGGIELGRVTQQLDPRWKRKAGRSGDLVLYAPTGWLTHGRNPREETFINYCDGRECGLYSRALLLGSTRQSTAADITLQPLGLDDSSLMPLNQAYASYTARLEAAGDNQTRLVLTLPNSTYVEHFTIDTTRHVLLKREWFHEGKLVASTTFADFVEVAGMWWATTSVTSDAQGRPTAETKLTVQFLNKDRYTGRFAAELADKPAVLFIHLPFVTLSTARQKVADGSAGFDEHLALILHNVLLQQWDDMWKHVEAAEKKVPNKAGVRWLRTQLQIVGRRHDELRQRLLAEARELVTKRQPDEVFLANRILENVYSLTAWTEFMEFVQILKPVFERPFIVDGQPVDDPERMAGWDERMIQCLDAVGRPDESLPMRRARASASPWHLHWQTDYATRLASSGRFDEAHAWLRQELARPERTEDEEETLRSAVCDLYRQQYRWAELLTWTTEWVAKNPESQNYNSAYAQHLAALIYNDQLETAYNLADQWLKDACIEGPLPKLQQARVETALNFANGNLYHISFHRMNPRWFQPLATAARFFVRHPERFDLLQRCVSNSYFIQSDLSDQLRGEWLNMLRTELARLNPGQINTLVGWTLGGRMEFTEPINGRKQLDASEIPNEIWQKIATELKPRWEQATEKSEKHLLSETLRTIYSTRFADSQLLPFLRQRLDGVHPDYRTAYVTSLFDQLLVTKWSEQIEQETFDFWKTLFKAPEPIKLPDGLEPAEVTRLRQLEQVHQTGERLLVEVPALYRLVDALLANRIRASDQQLNDLGGQDKLTRKELAAKKAELHKAARENFSKLLVQETAKADELLAPWIQMERIWLELQLVPNVAQIEEQCWKILGDAPSDLTDIPDDDKVAELILARGTQDSFNEVLRQRALTTVMNLAARKTAAAASIDRLLKYIDAGIVNSRPIAKPAAGAAAEVQTAGSRLTRTNEARAAAAMAWKITKFRMLVALDRPDALDQELRNWIRDDASTAPWRVWLARLLAERGKIDEAIQLFEASAKDKLLSGDDYRVLADWYLVSDRRELYERNRIEAFKQMEEGRLSQMIYQIHNRWHSGSAALPSELDENTLFVYKALFEKSAQPERYLHLLRQLYGACRDYRLMQMLPDSLLGRTPQQVYSYIQQLNGQVISELRNEATADEILTRIRKLREGKLTVTDQRALDLLEGLIERKSSEILNQPGPHTDACLAALQRAFQREWASGELTMMATFLQQLGKLPHEKLQNEQLREIRELQKLAPAMSREHLQITDSLCQLAFWHYGQRDSAFREMEVEVNAYLQANKGLWPNQDNQFLDRYIAFYEALNRHLDGEAILKKQFDRPENDEQKTWLHDRLMGLYNHALDNDGAVSLGTGRQNLFGPLVALTLKDIDSAPGENERYNLCARLQSTFMIAHNHKVPAVVEAVRQFAFEKLPEVLKKQQQHYRNTASTPLYVLGEVLGPRLTLQYILERMEQYPQRLEVQWDNSWQVFGSELAQRRQMAGSTDLDERVLKLAIAHLKSDLRSGEKNYPYIYTHNSGYFWPEKQDDFARAAEEVLNESRGSGRRAMTVARYLRNGLHRAARGIEIALIAHRQGLIEEGAQVELVQWLHEASRYGEMIPLLEPLVAVKPTNINYRTELMVAYFHSQRPEQLAELIQQTDTVFHKDGLWEESNVAQFARGCLATEQWERAKTYFTEAYVLHQRSNPASGINDSTLSDYYQQLARVESRLNHTVEAVTAASAAIVCWDPRHEHRAQALNTLREVLTASQNLDAYVAHLDAEAEKNNTDSPMLRKATGQVYQSRKEYAKAIVQLQLAIQLQPNDRESHQALIACYDASQNAVAATQQLLKLIELNQHDLALYQQLFERLKNNEAEAERAATSIVESAPNEAESHAALAEIRQTQNRWSEAIPHWQQVAQLRRLEPTGLLKLAAAQIHEKQWGNAKQSLEKLQRTAWPSRFNTVEQETRQLSDQLPKE